VKEHSEKAEEEAEEEAKKDEEKKTPGAPKGSYRWAISSVTDTCIRKRGWCSCC
jgi:hypothetical protein